MISAVVYGLGDEGSGPAETRPCERDYNLYMLPYGKKNSTEKKQKTVKKQMLCICLTVRNNTVNKYTVKKSALQKEIQ